MKQFVLACCTVLLSATAFAQQNDVLPRGFSEEEKQMLANGWQYSRSQDARGIASPPSIPVRTMAEWEEIQALCIAWTSFPEIHAQIVEAAQEECMVLIVCSDSNAVINALAGYNVTPNSNVKYLEAPFNSIWMRDYGANTVYYNDVDSMALVDWIYNRPQRPQDDAVPQHVADYFGVSLYETTAGSTDMVNTGGNWMVDGMGTAFASELILEENEAGNPYGVTVKTEADIDNIVADFHGIERYIKMTTLPYDAIHHIDMHMKLLDEETILVSKYPDGVADGPQIETNIEYVVNTFNSAFGTPYEIEWITVPPSANGSHPDNGGYYRTYTNQVFVNKTVILPTYREEYDTTAMRVLGELMPGYNLVGIDSDGPGNATNIIQYSGAIHCITKAVGVDDPLLINHQKLRSTIHLDPRPIEATIKHVSGIASATVYYSTDATSWQTIAMSDAGNDTWTATLPGQPGGTTVWYYIQAEANNGKQQLRPIVSPEGAWEYDVIYTPAGIAQGNNAIEVAKVYPNPAASITMVELEAFSPLQTEVEIVDVMGRVVERVHSGQLRLGTNKFFFDVSDWTAGVYTVVVRSEKGTTSQRLVVR